MKVNITVGSSGHINGYLNIDPITGSDDQEGDAVKCDVRNLDGLVMDSQCHEIIAENVLDYLTVTDATAALSNWTKKLRHKGRIIVGGTDAYEASKQFSQGVISLSQYNYIVHGSMGSPWEVKLSHNTVSSLESSLKFLGIKILKKRINGLNMVIEGERT